MQKMIFCLIVVLFVNCTAHQSYSTKKLLGYPVLPREESLTRASEILFGDDKNKNVRIGLTQFELTEAEFYLKYYLSEDPKSKEANLYLAILYNEDGDLAKSEEFYTKAHTLYPNDPAINKRVADFYYDKKDYEKSLPFYEKFLEQNIYSSETYMTIAMIYERLSKYESALENYLISREFDSENKFSNVQSEKLKWTREGKLFFTPLRDGFIECAGDSKEKIGYKIRISNNSNEKLEIDTSDSSDKGPLKCIRERLKNVNTSHFTEMPLTIEYIIIVSKKEVEREFIKPTWPEDS